MTDRGIRNNNPGNIRRSTDPWQGLAENQSAFSQGVRHARIAATGAYHDMTPTQFIADAATAIRGRQRRGLAADRATRVRGIIRDEMAQGKKPYDALRAAYEDSVGAESWNVGGRTGYSIGTSEDDWSPEARAAAARARREHSHGTPVKINAPGIKGHGEAGTVHNHPERAGGRHFVKSSSGEVHGPFHGHQLRATGSAPLSTTEHHEETVPTGTGRSIKRRDVNPVTKKLLGWK